MTHETKQAVEVSTTYAELYHRLILLHYFKDRFLFYTEAREARTSFLDKFKK